MDMTAQEILPGVGDRATDGKGREMGAQEQPEDLSTRARRLRSVFRWATFGFLLLLLAALIAGISSGVLTSVESLRAFVGKFGPLAPIAFIAAGAVEAVFPVIPGSGAVLSAPVIFGFVHGTIYAYLATCIGSMLVFLIARVLGRDLIVARVPEKLMTKYGKWLDHPKFDKYFALLIALPFAPDDVLCYLAGVTRMSWRKYVLILLLCKPWGVLLYTSGVVALLKVVFPWLQL